jgi:hypothetical protein
MSDSSLPDRDIAITAQPVLTSGSRAAKQSRRGFWRRVLRPLVLVLTAQYTIVLLVSLSVAGTVRALLLPQILDNFAAIAAALKRAPF